MMTPGTPSAVEAPEGFPGAAEEHLEAVEEILGAEVAVDSPGTIPDRISRNHWSFGEILLGFDDF
jgi:hypothetical protein